MSTENKAPRERWLLVNRCALPDRIFSTEQAAYEAMEPNDNCHAVVDKAAYCALQSQLDDCKRKGEEWQGCAESLAVDNKNLTSQLDEKTDECEKLKLQLKNRSSHLQTATVDGIHKAWEANAKLRAELEAAKAENERLFNIKIDEHTKDEFYQLARKLERENSDLRDEKYLLEAENKRLREALEFYANEDNYELVDEGRNYNVDYKCYETGPKLNWIEQPLGTLAREALNLKQGAGDDEPKQV